MIRQLLRPGAAAILCGAVVTACASSRGANAPPADLAELEAIYRARTDSARMRFTEADVRFMNGMIAHHAQAILMSRLAADRTSRSSVLTLAARIINAQHDEIATMQQWLADRGQGVPRVHIDGLHLHVDAAHHAQMPGMITQAQLEELARARDAVFDRLFLTFMIAHHRGAVVMVHELLATDGAAQDGTVFKFASDVQVDQVTEIARMEQMLSALAEDHDR